MSRESWVELAEGVFYQRYQPVNVNVGAVIGEGGALVIDTRATPLQGREVATDLRAITSLTVRWVVNTHYHWDHVFGNQVFREASIYGHPACRRFLVDNGKQAVADALSWLPDIGPDLADLDISPPDRLVDPSVSIDLGGRSVLIEHLGRAHTDSDVVVRVSDAPVVFAGDLFESAAPPTFGDSFPIAWPTSAGRVARSGDTAIVPGHGRVMSRAEVASQLSDLEAVAEICRAARREGLQPDQVDIDHAPYPETTMRLAIARGLMELG